MTPIIPLPPTVRPWFVKYGSIVLRAILQNYKPVDQIVSTSYLTTAIRDDPELSVVFRGMTHQTMRRAIVLCLRYCCGAAWYTNRRQQQRAVILPVPVGELERYVAEKIQEQAVQMSAPKAGVKA